MKTSDLQGVDRMILNKESIAADDRNSYETSELTTKMPS